MPGSLRTILRVNGAAFTLLLPNNAYSKQQYNSIKVIMKRMLKMVFCVGG